MFVPIDVRSILINFVALDLLLKVGVPNSEEKV